MKKKYIIISEIVRNIWSYCFIYRCIFKENILDDLVKDISKYFFGSIGIEYVFVYIYIIYIYILQTDIELLGLNWWIERYHHDTAPESPAFSTDMSALLCMLLLALWFCSYVSIQALLTIQLAVFSKHSSNYQAFKYLDR